MKVVFYTALFGGHDTLKEFDTGGFEFIAFTDDPELQSETWKVERWAMVGPDLPLMPSPRLKAKWFKMHPPVDLGAHEMRPGDISIWLDASITVTRVAKMVAVCKDALDDHDIAFFRHPERYTIYEECQASIALPKYRDQPLIEQVDAYRTAGLPIDHGLYAGGVIARRYGKTDSLDEMWWSENVCRTTQDQLSLPYVLWKLAITPGVIPGSVYGTDFHKHTWTGPEDKPQRRGIDLCVCGATAAMHPTPTCSNFVPHPIPDVLKPRAPEELAAIPPIPAGEIEEAIQQGARERFAADHPTFPAPAAPLVSVITPTHFPVFVRDCWRSLEAQTYKNFEWVVAPNVSTGQRAPLGMLTSTVRDTLDDDPRIRIIPDRAWGESVGARKLFAFEEAKGDILVEYDHDDILVPSALEEIVKAFEDPEVGFVYSDSIDFVEGDKTLQGQQTYRSRVTRPGWESVGFEFYEQAIKGFRAGKYECVKWHEPGAWMVSHIGTAPNHVRAWRRSVYEKIGGHNVAYRVCDDHELVLRTYLATKMKRIPKPLYLQRITGWNTWLKNVNEINNVSNSLRAEYLERLVLRECELLGLPAFDLGGGLYPRAGWTPVDVEGDAPGIVLDDLSVAPWRWADNSVGAFRASDLLEHLPDKMQTMREIHRCLRPGGWLLSMTPSALGWGAFADPTHCSYWVPQSFWPFTREQQAQYIRAKPLFREVHLDTVPIVIQGAETPYVRADLVKLPAWSAR